MLDREQLAGWIRTEEDPGIIKHCWLSINQPHHPALDRPNTKLGLINTRKDMQQLLFSSENNTCCSALASFGVSTSQPTLGLFSRMIFTLEFGIPSLEDVEPATVGEDMQNEQGFCHSSILCCSTMPQRALGSHFVWIFVFFSFSSEELGPNPTSDTGSEMFLFLISAEL